MAKDTNLYDTTHVTTKHPKMSDEELMCAYRDAWKCFYSKEHCLTLLLRRKGPRRRLLFSSMIWFMASVFLEGVPIESVFVYYPRRIWEVLVYHVGMIKLNWDIWMLKRIADRPENADYMDAAITPVREEKRIPELVKASSL